MGTVTDKLNKILSTKDAIKAAIVEKGQTVTDTDTFASYPDKIRAIESGSSDDAVYDILISGSSSLIYIYRVEHGESINIVDKNTSTAGYTQISNLKIGDMLVVQSRYDSEIVEDDCYDVVTYALDACTYLVAITGDEALFTIRAV